MPASNVMSIYTMNIKIFSMMLEDVALPVGGTQGVTIVREICPLETMNGPPQFHSTPSNWH